MDPSIVVTGIALAGTTFATYMTYRASRAATQVGVENTAIQRALQAEKKADAAQMKAEQEEQRANAFQIRLRQMEVRMVRLESKFRYFIGMLYDPYITVDLLRERIPSDFANTKDGDGNG